MEKKIKIGKQTLKLDNNVNWMFIYRDQFGRDIVPVLVPVLNAGIDVVFGIYKATGGKFSADTIMQIDTDVLQDALIEASGLEAVEILQVVWAMAKNADEDIDPPREWFRQFDAFPLDEIVPAIVELLMRAMVSTKNLKRLQAVKESLQPKLTSTGSSSQEQPED